MEVKKLSNSKTNFVVRREYFVQVVLTLLYTHGQELSFKHVLVETPYNFWARRQIF
jgi:uracil phosphoribosyltransferase